jgi:hypothetical protein
MNRLSTSDKRRFREDRFDDPQIEERYFHDVQLHGYLAITEVVEGHRTFRLPWMLLGRDGLVWDAGFWHNNSDAPGLFGDIDREVELRYPGIRVDPSPPWWPSDMPVPVAALWIAPDSPIQRRADVEPAHGT